MPNRSVHGSAATGLPAYPTDRVAPHLFFLVSAVFHYLGPAFAVLLFRSVDPLGVAWLRIASAAAVFSIWRKPWRSCAQGGREQWLLVILLGTTLAAMNCVFYEAIDRLPLGTVGAIEFLGPIVLAAIGARTGRNLAALALATAGALILAKARIAGQLLGYVFAFANCALFMLYIVLGHRIATRAGVGAIDRLGAAMRVATVAALPLGIGPAAPALTSPTLLGAAIGVGVSSSVIPYVCDQFAMARLPRATFALMLSLLPAMACAMGLAVLRQAPSAVEAGAIALVIVGVALHRPNR